MILAVLNSLKMGALYSVSANPILDGHTSCIIALEIIQDLHRKLKD